jgi:hypothetical protein
MPPLGSLAMQSETRPIIRFSWRPSAVNPNRFTSKLYKLKWAADGKSLFISNPTPFLSPAPPSNTFGSCAGRSAHRAPAMRMDLPWSGFGIALSPIL